jgi:hypothetical protein
VGRLGSVAIAVDGCGAAVPPRNRRRSRTVEGVGCRVVRVVGLVEIPLLEPVQGLDPCDDPGNRAERVEAHHRPLWLRRPCRSRCLRAGCLTGSLRRRNTAAGTASIFRARRRTGAWSTCTPRSAISSFRLRGAASNSQVGRANAPFDSHQPACCDRAYFSSIQIDVDGFDGEWRYSIRPGRNDDPISEQDLG